MKKLTNSQKDQLFATLCVAIVLLTLALVVWVRMM